MKVSAATLTQITTLKTQSKYVDAYNAVKQDLITKNQIKTAADQDVVTWLDTAIEINGGQDTFRATAVRANNVAAVAYATGKHIALFGAEQKAASDAVAKAFVDYVVGQGGSIQSLADIAKVDAGAGLKALGLAFSNGDVQKEYWAGAVPDNFNAATGLATNTYYKTELNDIERLRADKVHLIASSVLAVHVTAKSYGFSAQLEQADTDASVDNGKSLLQVQLLPIFQIADGAYRNTPQLVITAAAKAYSAAITLGGDIKPLQILDNQIHGVNSNYITKPNQFAISNDTLIQINDGKDVKDIFRVITLDTTNQQQYSSYEVSYNAKAEAQSLRTNYRDGQAGNAAYDIDYFTSLDSIAFFDNIPTSFTLH